ncbi:twin-arginine translocation signal domain-containing protein [Undibacterium luofuense]|uniref:twin-arginine translocation signal domain-containing protein n=1 Tax=Undibacterium luofuense TaxID=2828733 RepID=UPI003C6EAEDD
MVDSDDYLIAYNEPNRFAFTSKQFPYGFDDNTRLSRGLSAVLSKTMDRRAFLKRSGVTLGAGGICLSNAAAEILFSNHHIRTARQHAGR